MNESSKFVHLEQWIVALALAVPLGCSDPEAEVDAGSGEGEGASSSAADASTSAAVGDESGSLESGENPTGDDGPPGQGLPCEIDELLAQSCRSCHADPPVGAPMPLVDYDDLVAPAVSDPSRKVGELAVDRMASMQAPMPPPPGTPVDSASITVFAAWVAEGMPPGDCGTTGDESGSAGESGGPDADDPFDVDPMCSSGEFWPPEIEGESTMFPGRACITCHTTPSLWAEFDDEPDDHDDVPNLIVAGTVFPTAHEPNDCFAPASADARVEVLSDSGTSTTLEVNGSGNFMLRASDAPTPFEPPFRVKVSFDGRERVMPVEAPHGDCNACHTQDGANGAPGRILLP